MLTADVTSPYRYHKRFVIRRIWRDGKLAAFCLHPIEDCPYNGNMRTLDGRKRGPIVLAAERLKRAAWLDGWERQTAAMAAAPKEEPDDDL